VDYLSAKFISENYSNEVYKKFFEQSIDPILIADPESGNILECNQVTAGLVERTKDELIGQHESILYPPQESENGFIKSFKEQSTQLKKDSIELETKVVTKSGKIKNVLIKANLMDVGGKEIVYGSLRDVTQQKQTEAALRYSEEQFRN
jgi:PAS domain S-box-containing protein